jgi:hypothetical protein
MAFEQKQIALQVKYVDSMPLTIETGVLYVSKKHAISAHLCPCGCGQPIYIPFAARQTKTEWQYKEHDGKVTLHPSLLNTNCPNKAHYFIVDNEVRWC